MPDTHYETQILMPSLEPITEEGLDRLRSAISLYERPITFFEWGTLERNYSILLAKEFPTSCFILVTPNRGVIGSYPDNVIILTKKLTVEDLSLLKSCEHFDIVFLPDLENLFPLDCKGECITHLKSFGRNIYTEEFYIQGEEKKSLSFTEYGGGKESYFVDLNLKTAYLYPAKSRLPYLIQKIPGLTLPTFLLLHGVWPKHEDLLEACRDHIGKYAPWEICIQGKHVQPLIYFALDSLHGFHLKEELFSYQSTQACFKNLNL